MPGYFDVPEAVDLADGRMIATKVDGTEILIARVGKGFYAISNRCTHAGGMLSAGKLGGFVITCPLHGSQFDIRNGDMIQWTRWPGWISWMMKLFKPAKPLAIYEIRSEGGKVLVALD